MLSSRTLQKWHREFNAAVFGGELNRVSIWCGYLEPGVLGLCWGSEIAISDRQDEESARATLLHEMIHQWQFEHGYRMLHDQHFDKWREPCLGITGLRV